jgi:hypothetical protein
MEVGIEEFVRILADGSDQLAAAHLIALLDFYLAKMSIKGANQSFVVIFIKHMVDYDDVTPESSAVLSKADAAMRHCIDRLSHIGVSPASAVPVLARVNPHAIFFRETSSDIPPGVMLACSDISI